MLAFVVSDFIFLFKFYMYGKENNIEIHTFGWYEYPCSITTYIFSKAILLYSKVAMRSYNV